MMNGEIYTSRITLENFRNWKLSSITEDFSCIYMIKIKGKCYIGLTEKFFKRMKNHLWDINKRKTIPLYRAISNSDLDQCEVYILHVADSLEKLKLLEKQEIRERGTLFPNGLNSNMGGG